MTEQLMALLAEVAEIAQNPYAKAMEAKAAGEKVVGYFAMNYPEELIHAAGAYNLYIQESAEPVTAGHAYYYSFFCGPSRSLVDQAIKEQLDFLDVFIGGDYCIQEIGAAEVLEDQRRSITSLFFRLPVGNEPTTRGDIYTGLTEIKGDLERALDVVITDEAINNSIRLYNKNRALLREIYQIREENPGVLSSGQLVQVVQSSMIMRKEESNELLARLIEALRAEPKRDLNGQLFFLSGAFCGAPKIDILNIIERAGGVVVADDLVHGWRYISTDIEEGDDPLGKIADWYLTRDFKVPCPTRVNPDIDYPQYLVDQCKRYGVDEIFILQARYCEPHMFFFPDIKVALEAAGISYLLIDVEHEVVSLEALKTRIEAFVEMNQFKSDMAGV